MFMQITDTCSKPSVPIIEMIAVDLLHLPSRCLFKTAEKMFRKYFKVLNSAYQWKAQLILEYNTMFSLVMINVHWITFINVDMNISKAILIVQCKQEVNGMGNKYRSFVNFSGKWYRIMF